MLMSTCIFAQPEQSLEPGARYSSCRGYLCLGSSATPQILLLLIMMFTKCSPPL